MEKTEKNGFVKLVTKAGKLILLNLLWLLFSLGIITIGASTCAAFYVTLKMVDDEETSVWKMFVKAFKDNFKQGTVMSIITVACVTGAFFMWKAVIKEDPTTWVKLGAGLITAVFASINIFAYPLIARYQNTLINKIKNAIGISILYYIRAIILIVLVGLEVAFLCWNLKTFIAGLFFIPELIVFTVSFVSKRIFQNIEKSQIAEPAPKAEDITEEVDAEEAAETEEEEEDSETDDEETSEAAESEE